MSQVLYSSTVESAHVPRALPMAHITTNTVSSGWEDLEAQKDEKSISPRKITRASTFSTQGSTLAGDSSSPKPPCAGFHTPTNLHCANPLERVPTWLVEEEALHGYPKLASFLGGSEGYAIYRRFAFLNSRNLLYHQAKLVQLEHELNELEKSFEQETELHYTVRRIFEAEENSPGHQLARKYEEISNALDKYNRLLLEQQKLHQLPAPDDSFVESIHDFINSTRSPQPGWLEHPENTVYAVWDDNRKPVQKDLITFNRDLRAQDPFTKMFTGTVLNWWHKLYSRFKEPDDDLGGYHYPERALSRYMAAIVMIVASALPTCSIIALYFIDRALWRLIFVVLFSGVFAFALAFFTDARRVEVFAASLALASVQVVFVGTAFGNGNGNGGS